MAYIRKLPSGKWQATVRLPDGQRRSYAHPLRAVVAGWAADLEGDRRRGDLIDPRAGEITIGELWTRVRGARRLESASRRRDDSHWRTHVEPRWARAPVGAILQPDVQTWVVDMEQAGAGAATIQSAVGVLRTVLRHAVQARLIRSNPAARGELRMPHRRPHRDRVLDLDEDQPLLAALDRAAAGRRCGRLFAELLLGCGLRWSEAAGLDREHVLAPRLARQRLVAVENVVEFGSARVRPYPKTRAGHREVPVPDELWPPLRDVALAVSPGGLLFPGPLDYANWRARVWLPALAASGLADPQPTPHDLRHTYGTRLAERGVPVRDIMAVMGHESLRSAQRYIHATEGRHDRVRAAFRIGRTSAERHQPGHRLTSVDKHVS